VNYAEGQSLYLAHLEHVKRASPHTISNYARDLD
jgi:site-specific recombinase XerC